MSSSPSGPRRSQRDRKSVKVFNSSAAAGSVQRKRKRNDTDDQDNDALHALTDAEHETDEGNNLEDEDEDVVSINEREGEEEEEYRASGGGSGKKQKPKGTPKSKTGGAGTQTKRLRKAKTTQGPSKTGARRGRKPKEPKEGIAAAPQADHSGRDANIATDNALFNALVNPSVRLQSTAEDFIESLQNNAGTAQAELVNLILRCCGCNDLVDADGAVDYDGVVDALDHFTEGLKQENSPVYPLTSKLPAFKKFRKHLAEFIDRLINAAAELGLLYSTDLMATLQTWIVAMSSSQIRSFRHTATVIALELETALCDVAAAVEKEAEVVYRQREGEKKRKATNKSAGAAKVKDMDAKAKEIRKRRDQISEFLKEFVDGVFVHRYRDLDPNIRAECVRAIGHWFKKYPSHFLDASYLRYVGWVLSDPSNHVRLEAVRALSNVYDQGDFISSLNTFTERFRLRLIEMATLDVDVAVRVAVIHVLASIDGYSLLEEEDREKLCLLLFDEETRVRRAIAEFVRRIWSEEVEERSAGRKGRKKLSAKDKERVGIKAFAALMVQWGRTLDKMVGDDTDSEVADAADEVELDTDIASGGSHHHTRLRRHTRQRKELVALAGEGVGRVALAVEALWSEVEPANDWEGLLEILLLDHSAAANGTDVDEEELPERVGVRHGNGDGKRRKTNGEENENENGDRESEDHVAVMIDDAWRLEEVEEGLLLEVLVAAIRTAKAEAVGGKKGEEETVANDITRALIKGLPRLFIKHRADSRRIAEVLLLPTLMNLDLYLEMRMITSYASLWDDISKQFLSHSSLTVLSRAVSAIWYLLDATSLSNTNTTKMAELEEELSSTLHDAVGGREEIEVATFTEDEIITLGAICSRLAVLFGNRDMTQWMEEDEGGKQSNAWDIVSALSERGRLGYREEEMMVEQALQALTLHIMWKARGLTATEDPSPEESKYRVKLLDQRESLLEKLVEYAIGGRSNAVENVKRTAFKNLLDLHVLFSPVSAVDGDGGLLPTAVAPLTLEDEIQYRCAGYMQAEIERYAELVAEDEERRSTDKDKDSGDESGEGATPTAPETNSNSKSRAGKKKAVQNAKALEKEKEKPSDIPSRAELEQEYLFIDVVSTYIRAIRSGAIHIRHSGVLLAHYGRLGFAFDACTKVIVDVLREEGMMHENGDIVVIVVTQAMQEAFNLVLDGVVEDEDNTVQLAKTLSGCLVIRGSQLSIVKRLESQYVTQIHMTLIDYIVKKLAVYQQNKNKKLIRVAGSFFRGLLPLLLSVKSQEALEIKGHMDQALAQAKLEVPPTSKIWEPQRAYEKRLSTAMSKNKSGDAKARKRKEAAGVTDESENERIATDDEAVDGWARASPAVQPPPSRPRPRRVTRAHPDVQDVQPEAEVQDGNADNTMTTNGAQANDEDFDPTTPQKLVRQKSAYRTRTPAKSSSPPPPLPPPDHEVPAARDMDDMDGMDDGPSRQPSQDPSAINVSYFDDVSYGGLAVVTPRLSRKRPRPEEDNHQPEQETHDDTDLVLEEAGLITPVGDLQIRRKRIRH
ncbi:hypothetical protein M378DRAFT_107004 [Amanita muscaria Koide BX008]|uniref:SCD domain-containing protein n=1 Tax=Amanita muscaria (strain Koide BX008) TaxID=946122 RepID=A0A0C2X344_AMAMK|nr:hypothetical protein M378DRAFT_107004 [Amanita muscaria Koide BX008]